MISRRWQPRLPPATHADGRIQRGQAVLFPNIVRQWASINANHMLPSGSSLFRPHTQGAVDRHPTTFQRLLSNVSRAEFEAYLDAERQLGERYVAEIGGIEWLASFAPIGFYDRAFIRRTPSAVQLSGEQVEALGHGLATALNLYADLGFQSFNAALYGAPATGRRWSTRRRRMSRHGPASRLV